MQVSLFEPEIPQNTGTIARLCSCFDIPLNIIEPASFILDNKKFKRAGMDYLDHVDLRRHTSFENFRKSIGGRIILLDIKAKTKYFDINYREDDCLMVGKESTGVPDEIFDICDERVIIPMCSGRRSINVALSLGIVLGEALRQTKWNI